MILKIKSRKTASFKQLLDYLLHDEKRLKQKGKGFIIKHNVEGKTTKEMAQAFKDNEQHRINKRKDSTVLQHSIISLSNADNKHITPEKMELMAREFIKQRNPHGMYVIVCHFEKEHIHLHACGSAIEYRSGKSMRLSREELLKLKKDLQSFQVERFPELTHSIIDYSKPSQKKGITDKEYRLSQRKRGVMQKDELQQKLEAAFVQATSQEHFFELLNNSGLKVYERSGIETGIWYGSRKFRFKNVGFPSQRLDELNLRRERKRELSKVRNREELEKYRTAHPKKQR